jgi:hypothetical protein
MTWTVDSGDVVTYEYTTIGKTMFLNFHIVSTSVGGTLGAYLNIKIPNSKTCNKRSRTLCRIVDNGAAAVGFLDVDVGSSIVSIYNSIGTGNWSTSTNNTEVSGQIFFEIQ